MFKFMIKFLKILAIACLIGVSLRVIEVLFLKQQAKDLAVSNITNEVQEIQNEENLQIADNEETIVNETIEDKSSEEKAITETKREADIVQNKQEESVKTAKKETVKTQTNNENKKEEKQQTTTKQTITETSKQEVKETKQETPTQTETKTEEKYTEVVVTMAEKKECTGNNHGMEVGNTGKWFNTKDEAIATYRAELKIWGDKWTAKENPINKEEYHKNCPSGYEVWNCMYCGKWTLNYYYDN